MKRFIHSGILGAASILGLGCGSPACASPSYSNNFDTENGGVSAQGYTGFSGLNVSSGSVNLVHTGDSSGITCEGGTGGCVDLGGNTGQNGDLISTSYTFSTGSSLILNIGTSGSQRFSPDTTGLSFGFNFSAPTSGTFTFSDSSGFIFGDSFTSETQQGIVDAENTFDEPFDDLSLAVQATSAGSFTFFVHGGSPDPSDTNDHNEGMILDNLSLTISALPEPTSWAMLIVGFGFVGAIMRLRSKRVLSTSGRRPDGLCLADNDLKRVDPEGDVRSR